MEHELRAHLRACAEAYATATGRKLTTVAKLAAGDWRFFDRIADGKTFTARTYDEIMRWFSTNWPEGTPWPRNVPVAAGAGEAA
ncbi:hypothetical protein GGQ86_003007 [Xanthobacter flavus]|uniref:Uncharacterized protein n=1 Tax=Xanthobacter flavus TaxID=281 RepID=A0A9W6CJB5_XANFL|nr:hypothetical protein [Xanthobacter flavus]MDR6334525.1 hypothetical protein [Xanthobacter flavus]GLI23458.1 hypothetical protein XFLAVUS301_31320 [Xanthobacter flavus]